MDTKEQLKKLWQKGITKDGWGYDILEADLDGILKITSEWIDKNFIPVEAQVSQENGGQDEIKARIDELQRISRLRLEYKEGYLGLWDDIMIDYMEKRTKQLGELSRFSG